MISDKLKQIVITEYLLPSEKLISYKFRHQLKLVTQTYNFLLFLYVEDNTFGSCVERCILLGTSKR